MELFDEKDQERERVDNVYSGPKDDEDDDLLSDDDGEDDEILSDDDDDWDVETDQVLDDDEDEIVDVTDPDDDEDYDLLSDDDVVLDDEIEEDDEPTTESRAPQTFNTENTGFSSHREPRNSGSIGSEPGTGVGGGI